MNGMGRTLIGQLWQCWPLIGRSWCHAHCYDCWLQIILTHILTSIWKFHIHIYCLWDKNCVNPAKTNNPSVDQDSLYWQLVCLEWLSTLLIHECDILMFYASIQTVWSEVVMRPRCNACNAPRQSHGQPELGEPEMWILLNWIFTHNTRASQCLNLQGRATYIWFSEKFNPWKCSTSMHWNVKVLALHFSQ